ncbi:MAG: Secretion system C-terminal sorting domain, partial [Bacteroidota bacterium]
IYPNPAKESIVIRHLSLVNTIEINDAVGKNCISIINHQSPIINIEHLPSGIYFLKTIDDKGFKQIMKFVKE